MKATNKVHIKSYFGEWPSKVTCTVDKIKEGVYLLYIDLGERWVEYEASGSDGRYNCSLYFNLNNTTLVVDVNIVDLGDEHSVVIGEVWKDYFMGVVFHSKALYSKRRKHLLAKHKCKPKRIDLKKRKSVHS